MPPDPQNKIPWWRPAMLIFGRISVWVALPLVIALILGKYLDSRFGTRPWIFLGLTAVAFVISSVAIVRVVHSYIKDIEKNSKPSTTLENNNAKVVLGKKDNGTNSTDTK